MAITTRETTATGVTNKGAPLTNAEVDTNFIELQQNKLDEVAEDTTPQLGGDLDTNGNDIDFGDDGKAVFGDGDDLQIYHDGSNSYIREDGTGNLHIQGHNVVIEDVDGNNMAFFQDNQEVSLYYNHNVKLETTNTGIDVTGDVNSDSVTTGTFTSTGIDDNATSTAITIDSSENVSLSNDLTVDTNTLVVDSTNNRVGIGESSPEYPLSVSGDVQIEKATAGILKLKRDDTVTATGNGIGQIQAITNEGGTDAVVALMRFEVGDTPGTDGEITLQTGGSERFRVDSSGNVGIGTSNVNTRLHVKGTTTSTLSDLGDGTLYVQSSETAATEVGATLALGGNYSGTTFEVPFGYVSGVKDASGIAGNLVFHTRASGSSTPEVMRLTHDGNVGIGTNIPSCAFHVKNDDYLKVIVQDVSGTDTPFSIGSGGNGFTIANNTSGNTSDEAITLNSTDQFAAFYTAGTRRMTLDSSGNLLVGKTGKAFNTVGIELLQGSSLNVTTASGNTCLNLQRQVASGAFTVMSFFGSSSVAASGINANIGGTASFYSSSDIRLKDNVTDHESELANVMSLRPVRWDWKGEKLGSGEGFVAQELEQTAWSDLVSEGDDGYKQVSGLGAVETRLIKALQEAVTRIETLEAEVAALKGAN